ncbi:MAG: glycosyltransferase family 2 protein [Candidatus Binatia bacterium]
MASARPTPAVAVLIPALDCAPTIAGVVEAARAHVDRVLVVDDGSADDTATRATAAGAAVLRQKVNRGKGAALRAGMQWLAARGVTHVLTMDGDGQHLASEIPVLLAAAAAAPDAIMIGARQVGDQEVTALRLFGNRFANRWVEIACGARVADSQSGFRVYPAAATLAIGGRSERFAFETEVLIRAARAGLEIRSVPVAAYYPPADVRISHYRPWRDTVHIIAVVLGLMFRLR